MVKQINVEPHSRGESYVRGHPRDLYVDKDFGTKSIRRNGELAGRKDTTQGQDFTAPIRDSKGRIHYYK